MFEALRFPFMQQALAASVLVAAMCGYLGVYVVLKRIVFVGAALAQASAAGVALAFLLGWNPSALAVALALLGVLVLAFPPPGQRLPRESVLGLAYAAATALGILFVAQSPMGHEDVESLLFGNVLTVTTRQIMLLAAVFLPVAAIHGLLAKEFLFVSFDPEMARALGLPAKLYDLLLYLTLGVVISVAIRAVGALLVFTFLVVPAMTALTLAQRLRTIAAVSVGMAGLAAVAGVLISFRWDVPSGPTVVTLACALMGLAALVRAAVPALAR